MMLINIWSLVSGLLNTLHLILGCAVMLFILEFGFILKIKGDVTFVINHCIGTTLLFALRQKAFTQTERETGQDWIFQTQKIMILFKPDS